MKRLFAIFAGLLLSAGAFAQNNISLPAGTSMKVKLDTTIATSSNKTGDPFSGRVTEAVLLDGKTVIPIGATVEGRVTQINEARRITGKPTIGIFPESLVMPNGDKFILNAMLVDTDVRHGTNVNNEGQFKGKGHDGKDLTQIGMATGGGMLAGGLISGANGMVIGGAIGATATVTHWLIKKRSTELPAGTELVMELSRPLEMKAAEGQGQ